MACYIAALIVLSGFFRLSAADKSACDIHAEVGQKATLPCVCDGLKNTDELKWTHNRSVIFHRQRGAVIVGTPRDVSSDGSLLLKDLKYSSGGIYQAHVSHTNSTQDRSKNSSLCIWGKVSKPRVSFFCDLNLHVVNLYCLVDEPKGLTMSWTLNDKLLENQTKDTLSMSLMILRGTRFACSVRNHVSRGRSDSVRPNCKPPTVPSPLCFQPVIALAALGSVTALILILIVVIVLLYCRHRRSVAKARLADMRELQVISAPQKEKVSAGPDYETMHAAEESQPPSSKPPESCQDVSQPDQTDKALLQPPTAGDGQKISPVPKPRTKSPQTKIV